MGITRYAAPSRHARIATRSIAGGRFSSLCCRSYQDCAPTELMIPESINARNRPVVT
jgi:hypothetical protein